MKNIDIWNLRGHAVPLDQLVPDIIKKTKDKQYDAIILDPIYKILTGDENSATEMAKFTNQFDRICTETGCAAIYCHHHSKGAQGSKRAMEQSVWQWSLCQRSGRSTGHHTVRVNRRTEK